MSRLQGRVAIITGASSGIGAATARLFVAQGANVIIADMQEEKGQALADELGSAAAFERVDVSREHDAEAAVGAALSRWGRLDVMFNNAGFGGAVGPIQTTSVEDFELTFDVLVKGVFLGIKHATPVMREQGSGSIINTASVAGLQAGWSPHLYSTAKSAVIHLTKTVALELGDYGIRCNCICPGVIATPLAAGHQKTTPEQLEKMKKALGRTQVLGRIGDPSDIANAAMWLASDESSFVTGHAQIVDGGAYAGRPWNKQGAWITEAHPIKMYRPDDR
jgi:NAD(P)-dependent dehydrogenase (short-subunit alcohol dehydrogenase family)